MRPTGCAVLTDPGRRPRRALLGTDLAAIAPAGEWARLLKG